MQAAPSYDEPFQNRHFDMHQILLQLRMQTSLIFETASSHELSEASSKNHTRDFLTVTIIFALALIWSQWLSAIYARATYDHPRQINDVLVGTCVSDLVFKHGLPDIVNENNYVYTDYFGIDWIVSLDDEECVRVITDDLNYLEITDYPFRNIQEMEEVIGEPDILAISEDYLERRLTYLFERPYGITYIFVQDRLDRVMLGEVRWRRTSTIGDYILRGKQICFREGQEIMKVALYQTVNPIRSGITFRFTVAI